MKTFISYILFTVASLFIMSCKNFLEIDPPKTQIIGSTVFQTNSTANSAMINAYTTIVNQIANPYIMALYPGLSADELKTYSSSITLRQLYTNKLNPSDGPTKDIWTGGYNCIYQANAIIEGCKLSSALSANLKKQLIAESLFLRAFWHFYLFNEFGEIPIVTTTDYNANARLAKSSKELIYQQIITDLINAQTDLNDEYVDGTGLVKSLERLRVNKSVATALLARVYLYDSNYLEAEKQASKIIVNKEIYDLVPLDQVFLKNSKESIWQLMKPLPSTQNTWEGTNFILTSKPGTGSTRSSTISTSLFNAFEANDQRKMMWIGKLTNAGIDYYFPYKYKVSSGAISEYSMIMRLAEQYLIRSEARAQQGNLSGAIEDIDAIRKRAGLPLIKDTNPNIEKDDLLTAILKERRVELFTEWGHRWMDIKRTRKIDAVMTIEAVSKESTWDSRMQLYPVPQNEINNNSNLKQNIGYN